jgi:tRNA-dihydrouridine synthase
MRSTAAQVTEEAYVCCPAAARAGFQRLQNHSAVRADWEAIAAVRKALRIPVLANGEDRTREPHVLFIN